MPKLSPACRVVLLFAFGLGGAAAMPALAQTVEIAQGAVRGEAQSDVTAYRGIPYGAPPVGARRWSPPEPAPAWQGVRDARRYGPACIQPEMWQERAPDQSEDCLNLNVWTPRKAGSHEAPLPVMVWIHGGGFVVGSNAMPVYDGAQFARRDVVLVSINYRLGLLGFFAHPALLAQSSDAPTGNFGLLDTVAALEWVKQNIAAFGGDPQNVTIFGESAGAAMVNDLMVSPRARGLFHKATRRSRKAVSTAIPPRRRWVTDRLPARRRRCSLPQGRTLKGATPQRPRPCARCPQSCLPVPKSHWAWPFP
ncbi:carboxylesterase family protein [Novosphingobium decolorationis]|uniref:Carboxylic ester hydrolase n=1 Tax=Novosphingobium decolorationis TaxID=2698673 RepID=A0ABX8E7T5_9SPHN|nr:carboxylesterase family protein [Novosphingobium decolorationis]MED5543965.1 carboxylesterase family protein [Pseudomonadota bacterium]QVM84126.1 carboxylesterase family protein [Novosphingobium decolorationis]